VACLRDRDHRRPRLDAACDHRRRPDRAHRSARRLLLYAVGEVDVLLCHSRAHSPVPSAGHHGAENGMKLLFDGVSGRALLLLALFFVALAAAPFFVNDYILVVLITILYFAYAGQCWNIMMGFAGQLSLGHALYIGLGAYVAAALFVKFGVGPWIGLMLAVPVAAVVGAFIGFLAFRFGVSGDRKSTRLNS